MECCRFRGKEVFACSVVVVRCLQGLLVVECFYRFSSSYVLAGSLVVVTGPVGCGKSSLLSAVLALPDL